MWIYEQQEIYDNITTNQQHNKPNDIDPFNVIVSSGEDSLMVL